MIFSTELLLLTNATKSINKSNYCEIKNSLPSTGVQLYIMVDNRNQSKQSHTDKTYADYLAENPERIKSICDKYAAVVYKSDFYVQDDFTIIQEGDVYES